MTSIEDITASIIFREGGFVYDPDDPGGPTKYGVTLAIARQHNLDKDGDGWVTAEDVKRLTKTDAKRIILHAFFRKPKIDKLPKALHPTVSDMQVNAGANAIKILQRLLAKFDQPVNVDGVLGIWACLPTLAKSAEISKTKTYLDLFEKAFAPRHWRAETFLRIPKFGDRKNSFA